MPTTRLLSRRMPQWWSYGALLVEQSRGFGLDQIENHPALEELGQRCGEQRQDLIVWSSRALEEV
jgi:hypothetical protein